MQHVKAYRGAMTPSAPTRRTRSESYVTELQPAVQSATLQIEIIAKANLGRAEDLLGVEQIRCMHLMTMRTAIWDAAPPTPQLNAEDHE
jgi:hypothetical protein